MRWRDGARAPFGNEWHTGLAADILVGNTNGARCFAHSLAASYIENGRPVEMGDALLAAGCTLSSNRRTNAARE